MKPVATHGQSLPANRVFGLDLLRALAVLFVVYSHAYPFIQQYLTEPIYTLPIFDGVSIFFVLSGFLIGRILIKMLTQTQFDALALRTFWVRRWMRTLPNYFLVLTFLVISALLLGQPLPGSLPGYFLFSQNLWTPHPDFFPEAWSLAVEEWFYLCIPLPFLLIARVARADRRRLVLSQIVLFIVVITLFRTWRAHDPGFISVEIWDATLRKQVFMRFDALLFGVLGAYASLYWQGLWTKTANKAFWLGVLLFLLDKLLARYPASQHFYLNYFTFSVTGAAALLMLPKLSTWQRKPDTLTQIITQVSLLSYAMYLLNLSVVQGVLWPLLLRACATCAQGGVAMYLLYWLLTFALSYLLYHYFERPMTAMRELWQPRHGSAVAPYAANSQANNGSAMPLISVVIASYNHAPFVQACLQSVLHQEGVNIEILVTDDGSTDDTPQRIGALADPRIRPHFFPQNRGACAALNDAIRRARGDFIAVLNSDDIFLPGKLRRQVDFLVQHPDIGAVYGWPTFIDERGAPFSDEAHKDHSVFHQPNRSRQQWLRYFFDQGNALCHPTVMLRREVYTSVGLYDPRLAQVPDLDMWIRVCMRFDIHVLPEPLTAFRIRDQLQNASAARPEVIIRDAWERARILRHYLLLPATELLQVFPEFTGHNRPLAEQLARYALELPYPFYHRFALDAWFDAMPPELRLDVETSESDDHMWRSFIAATGRCDLHRLYP